MDNLVYFAFAAVTGRVYELTMLTMLHNRRETRKRSTSLPTFGTSSVRKSRGPVGLAPVSHQACFSARAE